MGIYINSKVVNESKSSTRDRTIGQTAYVADDMSANEADQKAVSQSYCSSDRLGAGEL